MNFNPQIKILLSLCFLYILTYCDGIGEDPPPIPIHHRSLGVNCEVDYKQELQSYFLAEQRTSPSSESTPNENRTIKAINCLIALIEGTKKLIKPEEFTKQELLNTLNEKFIKDENIKPLIDYITHPDYFNSHLLIKNRVIHIMELQQTDFPVTAEEGCYPPPEEDNVLSKQEVDTVVKFLKTLSKWLVQVEHRGNEFFEDFFKAENRLSPSKWKDNPQFKEAFVKALSQHTLEDFPEYSRHLNNLEKDQRAKVIEAFLTMAKWPLSFSQALTSQNVKYIMLNIYITQTIFSIYNTNGDSVLDSKELNRLSCLLVPVVRLITLSLIEDQLNLLPEQAREELVSPKNIVDYYLHYQTPIRFKERDFSYAWFVSRQFFYPQEFDSLDYTDISRVIMAVSSTLFELKIFFPTKNNESSEETKP